MSEAMTDQAEQDYETILRWMRNNILIAAAIYHTNDGRVIADPALRIDNEGRIVPGTLRFSEEARGKRELSSVLALVCCCYLDALGKVYALATGHSTGSKARTLAFIRMFMQELDAECGARGEPYTVERFYADIRSGFVHQFAGTSVGWARSHNGGGGYWLQQEGLADYLLINVDRLAQGTLRAIDAFQEWFGTNVTASDPNKQFIDWLGDE